MASSIDETTISLTRGDSFFTTVTMYRTDGSIYTPVEGDTIRFALKRNVMNSAKNEFLDKTPLILKDIPIDTLMLHLTPEDTKELNFGTYAYDIELTYANGDVDTFIADAKFILTRELH